MPSAFRHPHSAMAPRSGGARASTRREALASLAAAGLSMALPRSLAASTPSTPSINPAAPIVPVDAPKGEFCLVVVPDTQRYALYFPDIFLTQFRWIREQHAALNIRFVLHVGDVVEENGDEEWRVADQAFSLLDGVVPYLVVPGNHDLERRAGGGLHRTNARYNAVFSPKRFAGCSWYGGCKGVTADNSFGYFNAGGQDFMVLGLEYGPTDETLEWARVLVSNHEDRHKVILLTHCYMYDDDTRLGEGDQWSPRKGNPDWNDGEGIWEKFVRRTENVAMVISGHVKGDGTGRLVSQRNDGGNVLQMLSNYQFLEHGGQGWLRILRFRPAARQLDVFTYSPWLRRFREEPDQQFSVEVPWLFP